MKDHQVMGEKNTKFLVTTICIIILYFKTSYNLLSILNTDNSAM